MLILYVQDGCLFSKKVREEGAKLGIVFDLRDIGERALEEELISRGGKRQTPYLVDEEQGVSLYGSDEILGHLRAFYPAAP